MPIKTWFSRTNRSPRIATHEELSPSTLVERIVQELSMSGGVVIGRGEIGAWASRA